MENKKVLLEKLEHIDKALTVACELTGTELSAAAKAVMVEDLMVYPLSDVLNALNRCRRELTGRLTLAAVMERIDSGLIGADEAFGLLAEAYKNEALTVVVPEIALLAMGGGANGLLAAGDKTGARMAFKESYNRLAADAKTSGKKPVWTVSAGTDKLQMAFAVQDAVSQGRLSRNQALMLLPADGAEVRHKLQTGLSLAQRESGKAKVSQILALIAAKKTMRPES